MNYFLNFNINIVNMHDGPTGPAQAIPGETCFERKTASANGVAGIFDYGNKRPHDGVKHPRAACRAARRISALNEPSAGNACCRKVGFPGASQTEAESLFLDHGRSQRIGPTLKF